MNFFDSHCHFDFAEFDPIRNQVWESAVAKGVLGLVMPGVSPHRDNHLKLAAEMDAAYWAAGLHPWWIQSFIDQHHVVPGRDFQRLLKSELINQIEREGQQYTKLVAIGESGLDKLRDVAIGLQVDALRVHIELALEMDLPLIVHSVKTHDRLLAELKRFSGESLRGVVHGFSGSYEQALLFVKAGMSIGVGGTITYERAGKTRDAVARLPLSSLLLETDAPSMPLAGRQGHVNRPDYLPDVFTTLAHLRHEDPQTFAAQLLDNARGFFNLPSELGRDNC